MRLQMGPRSENNHADSLDNLKAATEFQFRQKISVEHITNPSVQQPIGGSYATIYLTRVEGPHHCLSENRALPYNRAEARKLQHLATMWPFLEDILFKKSCFRLHSDPCLRCLESDKARKVMQEIHDGDCGNHSGGRSLTHKVINQGYYWLKMFDDVKDYIKKCPQCQRFAPASDMPSTDLPTLRSH